MKQQQLTGFTIAEIQEFKKLHDADANMLHQIIQGNTRLESLEIFVNSLDPAVNTRMVTQHEDRIKNIEAWQKKSDESRAAWEARMWSATQSLIVLVAGMAITGALSIVARLWNRFKLDPDRRSAAALEIDQKADARIAGLSERLEAVKSEVAETRKVVEQSKPKDWKDLDLSAGQ